MKLIIKDDSGKNTPVQLTRDEITVGRKEGNTIQLTEKNVSRTHARFLKKGDEITIEDLSRYGTRVNGERITSRRVGEGDLIVIGDYVLTLEGVAPVVLEDAPPPPGTAAAMVSAMSAKKKADVDALARAHLAAAKADLFEEGPPGLPPSLPGDERKGRGEGKKRIGAKYPTLVAVTTQLAGTEYPIKDGMVTVGRTGESTMQIDHHSISRHHAKIVVKDEQVRMMDLQSKNGIRVNGEYWEESVLKSGDIIELGKVQFRFVEAGEEFVYRPSEYSEDLIGTTLTELEPKKRGTGGTILLILMVLIVGGLVYFFIASNKASDVSLVNAPPVATAKPTVAAANPAQPTAAGEQAAQPAVAAAKPPEPEAKKALTAEQVATLGDQLAAAQTAIGAQKWADADKALAAIEAIQADHADAKLLRAKVTSEQRAQAGLEEAKKANAAKKHDEAWEALKALESVPADSTYLKDINALRGTVATTIAQKHVVASQKALKEREWETAISEAEKARTFVSNHKEVPDLIEKAQRGKYQQARRQLEREMEAQKKAGPNAAAAEKPQAARPARELYQEARALHHTDQNRALELYEQAAKQNHAMAYRMIGSLKAQRHDRRGAVEAYKKYLQLAPNAQEADDIRKIIDDFSR